MRQKSWQIVAGDPGRKETLRKRVNQKCLGTSSFSRLLSGYYLISQHIQNLSKRREGKLSTVTCHVVVFPIYRNRLSGYHEIAWMVRA